MFDPHKQGIRSRERYERDGPFVSLINESKHITPPPLWKGQAETTVSKDLGNGNHLLIIHNILLPDERVSYLQRVGDIQHVDSTIGNSMEMNFTRDGSVPSYADVNQPTQVLPSHILEVAESVSSSTSAAIAGHIYTVLDTCAEIKLGKTMVRGGNICQQSDNLSQWGCISILSFGQTRWMRISKVGAQGTINVSMPDNSLLVMYGLSFQQQYQYQVDELPDGHSIGVNLLLKMRFRKPYSSNNRRQSQTLGVPSSRAWLKTAKQSSN